MLMRSYSSVMVVSSAVMRPLRAARNAGNAIALAFPPLQQKSASSSARASLMARRIFHADAKLAPQRRKAVHFLILLVGEIIDAGIDAEAARDIISRREIDERVARVDYLPRKIVVEALTGEISR